MYAPPRPKMYEHRATLKKNLDEFLKGSWFDELKSNWIIQRKDINIKDRITVLEVDPESPYGDSLDVTPCHNVSVLHFSLNNINHRNFDFVIYDDYEKPDLIYFKPAVYYYGNYVKDNVFGLITLGKMAASFKAYCQELEGLGDNFAMHNYKIDMETVEKYNLMR